MSGEMENFFDAYRAGAPMLIEHRTHRRLTAAIVVTDAALAFADFGWDEPMCSFHPFHVVEGSFDPSGPGPWSINGEARICLLTERDRELTEWRRVVRYYGARFCTFRAAGEGRLTTILVDWSLGE